MASSVGNDIDGKLTRQDLKSASNEFDLDSIHTVNLSKRNLSNISAISECTALERLNLSYNDISRLQPLSSLTSLQVLDVSANRITTLDGLGLLDKLERLNLAGNLIGSLGSLRSLASLEKFKHLRLDDRVSDLTNPICNRDSYKQEVLTMLPRLESLDGVILVGQDAEVFRIIDEIETHIRLGSPRSGPTKTTPPPPQLPNSALTRPWADNQTDTVNPAEQQFRLKLETCKSLKARSDRLIQEAQIKLRQNEKV